MKLPSLTLITTAWKSAYRSFNNGGRQVPCRMRPLGCSWNSIYRAYLAATRYISSLKISLKAQHTSTLNLSHNEIYHPDKFLTIFSSPTHFLYFLTYKFFKNTSNFYASPIYLLFCLSPPHNSSAYQPFIYTPILNGITRTMNLALFIVYCDRPDNAATIYAW